MKKCKFCAEEIQDDAIKCKHCGSDLAKALTAIPPKPVLATNWKRVGVVSFITLVVLIIIGLANNNGGQNQTPQPAAPVTNTTSNVITAPVFKTMSYQVVDKWNYNSGIGEDIVVPASYLNDADMTNLGQTLKTDMQSYANATVLVYTDKQAAMEKNKVLADDANGTATKAELTFYDNHFVGTYTKNASTGYHHFQIMFGGVDGTNDKDIAY